MAITDTPIVAPRGQGAPQPPLDTLGGREEETTPSFSDLFGEVEDPTHEKARPEHNTEFDNAGSNQASLKTDTGPSNSEGSQAFAAEKKGSAVREADQRFIGANPSDVGPQLSLTHPRKTLSAGAVMADAGGGALGRPAEMPMDGALHAQKVPVNAALIDRSDGQIPTQDALTPQQQSSLPLSRAAPGNKVTHARTTDRIADQGIPQANISRAAGKSELPGEPSLAKTFSAAKTLVENEALQARQTSGATSERQIQESSFYPLAPRTVAENTTNMPPVADPSAIEFQASSQSGSSGDPASALKNSKPINLEASAGSGRDMDLHRIPADVIPPAPKKTSTYTVEPFAASVTEPKRDAPQTSASPTTQKIPAYLAQEDGCRLQNPTFTTADPAAEKPGLTPPTKEVSKPSLQVDRSVLDGPRHRGELRQASHLGSDSFAPSVSVMESSGKLVTTINQAPNEVAYVHRRAQTLDESPKRAEATPNQALPLGINEMPKQQTPIASAVHMGTQAYAAKAQTLFEKELASQQGENNKGFSTTEMRAFAETVSANQGRPFASESVSGTTASPPAMPTAQQVKPVLMQIVQASQASPNQTVEIRLYPEELGTVKYRLSVSEAGAILVVTAERPETLDLLRRNSSELLAEFRDSGVTADDLSFEQGTKRENGSGSSTQDGATQSTLLDDPVIETHHQAIPLSGVGIDIRL